MLRHVSFTVLLMLFSTLVMAGEGQAPTVSVAYLAKMLLSLLLVLALLLGFMWVLRRAMHMPGTANRGIKIVTVTSIGTRERLMVIEVGGEQILLGITPNRIEKLHLLAQPLDTKEPARPVMPAFAQTLQAVLQKNRSSGEDQ